jgi:hypothetical protein
MKLFVAFMLSILAGLIVQIIWPFSWLSSITAGNIACVATAIILLVLFNDR